MLLETTINQLEQTTNTEHNGDRDGRSKAVVFVGSIQATKTNPGILFIGTTQTGHKVQLRPLDVEEIADGTVVQLISGESMTIAPISKLQANVQLNCSCEDFTFRLARADSARGILFGRITKPYTKKTTAPANTTVGVCKHLMKMVDVLTSVKVFV